MRGRRLILTAAAALLALLVAACGGSSSSSSSGNGVATKTANQIVAQSTKAINGVQSVKVSGSVKDGSDLIKLDLSLENGKGATGSMSENGLSFKLITVGGEAYINGSAGFWKHFGGTAAVQLLKGRWLRAPSGSGDFASFASLTNVHKLLSALLEGHGALTRGATSTVDGTPVIAVHDTSKGGTLYVATSGDPYPIQITNNGTQGGQLDFSAFNQPVTLTAPAQSIDISKLGK
jgi:hypothetical protein